MKQIASRFCHLPCWHSMPSDKCHDLNVAVAHWPHRLVGCVVEVAGPPDSKHMCVRLKVQTHASAKATAENAEILLRSANRGPSGDVQITQSSRARPYTRQRDCGAVSGEGGSRQACTGYGVVDKVEGVAGGP